MCSAATIHPFENAGLGQAPFKFHGITEMVIRHANGYLQPSGTCDFCGTGIKYACNISSADGKNFIVGCDCVRKLDRADNKIISEMEREIAKRNKAQKDAERAAKWKAKREATEAALQVERDANNGLTLAEVAQREAQQKAKQVADEMFAEQSWLINVLNGMSGDFCASMCEKLYEVRVAELSDRQIDILRNIYGKSHGRSGSKKYDAACSEFDVKAKLSNSGE